MKKIVYGFCFVLVLSMTFCGTVWAQATAQISGTVRDQTGAVLPGVEVTAVQTETGIGIVLQVNDRSRNQRRLHEPVQFVRWSNPNTNITSAAFGTVTGTAAGRTAQLNATLKF